MIKEDFFTGEPVNDGSPPSSPFSSEMEAVENAGFGKYDYDPGARLLAQQPMYQNNIYPGGYGYVGSPYMMNQQIPPTIIGLGANPYGSLANPALLYQQQMMQQQMQQPQEITYRIEPFSFSSSEYLPPSNYEEEIEKLKLEYWNKQINEDAKSSVDRGQSGYGNNYGYNGFNNYYGVPYYSNPWQYNSIDREVAAKIEQMKNDARNGRIQFNLNLSKLAHNYSKDEYDEDELKERFEGKTVVVPGNYTTTDLYQYNRFQNMIPFDNSEIYRAHNAEVSREFNSVIPNDSSMKDTFDNLGILMSNYALQEEAHRRRNGAVLYNSENDGYKYFVKKKAEERYAASKGYVMNPTVSGSYMPAPQLQMPTFPTLNQTASLADDGTLNITCNFGSKAGQVYSVHNENEAAYEKERERFKNFIDSIPGSIYLTNPNKGGGADG